MRSFIDKNTTIYSTEDIEAVVQQAYRYMRAHPPSFVHQRWEHWDFRFVRDVLPMSICYWEPDPGAPMETRMVDTGRAVGLFSEPVGGPWFIGVVTEEPGLAILAPDRLAEAIGDMEALALSHEGSILPTTAVVQILFALLTEAGVRLAREESGGVREPNHSPSELYLLLLCYVEHRVESVRVHIGGEKESGMSDSLQKTHCGPGSRRGLPWKRWTIKDKELR